MKRYSALVLLIFFIVGCSNANAEYHTYKIVEGMFDYDQKIKIVDGMFDYDEKWKLVSCPEQNQLMHFPDMKIKIVDGMFDYDKKIKIVDGMFDYDKKVCLLK
tara:strand:+ start:383 stop:691 length:309 start_codon:yes stop_codon:yes gene_type:complete